MAAHLCLIFHFERARIAMDTIQKYFRVKRRDMAYLKYIVESYEGLAVLSTVDSKEGLMEWMIPPDRLEEAEQLIDSLREEVAIEPVNPPKTSPS